MNTAITRLEEKIAYLERHVAEQDKAMLEMAEDLERVKKEITLLRGRIAAVAVDAPGLSVAREERPPHY
jgi:SlyX protein